jgi:hypothetical protein
MEVAGFQRLGNFLAACEHGGLLQYREDNETTDHDGRTMAGQFMGSLLSF